MIEVRINDKGPNEVMDIARALKQRGYVQGIDFDWEYHKPKYDDIDYTLVYDRHTIFRFYKDELATWFELVYG